MSKKTIEEKAKELGIKEENLKVGLKADKTYLEDAIEKAHKFMKGKK